MKKKTHIASDDFKPTLPDSLREKVKESKNRKIEDGMDTTKKLINILSRERIKLLLFGYDLINEFGKRNPDICQYLRDFQSPMKNIKKELDELRELKVLKEEARMST